MFLDSVGAERNRDEAGGQAENWGAEEPLWKRCLLGVGDISGVFKVRGKRRGSRLSFSCPEKATGGRGLFGGGGP